MRFHMSLYNKSLFGCDNLSACLVTKEGWLAGTENMNRNVKCKCSRRSGLGKQFCIPK